jgi:hypothetical protein
MRGIRITLMKKETILTSIELECPYCGYKWSYGGRFFIYATCPSCRRNIRINENKVVEVSSLLQSVTVRGQQQIAAVDRNTSTPIKEPTCLDG